VKGGRVRFGGGGRATGQIKKALTSEYRKKGNVAQRERDEYNDRQAPDHRLLRDTIAVITAEAKLALKQTGHKNRLKRGGGQV